MNKYVLTLAVAGLIASPTLAKANDHAAMKAEVAAPAVAAEVKTEATTTTTTTTETKAVEHELADGTKVVVEGDMVSVVAADGTKTPAPDGTHTFKDGTTATVKEGKLVK